MNSKKYKQRLYKKGSVVWIENSKAMPYFFIIESGQLKQTLRIMNMEEVAVLNKGDTFGLISCLTGHDYINRLIAVSDSAVIMIQKENIFSFLSSKPEIFLKIVGDYSNRLRKINQKLFILCSKSIYSELPNHLLEIAEHYKNHGNLEHHYYALSKYVEHSDDPELKEKTEKKIAALEKEKNLQLFKAEIIGSHAIYKPGEIIFLEQEKGDNFYFIEKGKVKITHIDREAEFVVALLNEGEFFGEMAILNQVARNATAVAFKETRLLILTKDTFIDKLGNKILEKIFLSFAKRIWYSYRRALNLCFINPVTRLYDCLDFIIKSKEGEKKESSHFFDISITDLRVMTNTLDVEDRYIADFLNDGNMQINYGLISIIDTTKFNDTLNLHHSRERLQQASN